MCYFCAFNKFNPRCLRERPFDFYGGGERGPGGGAGQENFSREKYPGPNFQLKIFRTGKKSSTVFANKKTGSRSRRKKIPRPENIFLSPHTPIKIKWSFAKLFNLNKIGPKFNSEMNSYYFFVCFNR